MDRYIIPQGDHYSNLIPELCCVPTIPGIHRGITKLEGKIKFDKSCRYDLLPKPCTYDTNKAIGFGYGWWPNAHHTWSIRLGWRINAGGNLILLLYVYNNGKRIEKVIGSRNSFKFDTTYDFVIENDLINKKAIVRVGDLTQTTDFNKSPETGWILKPYFGGDCTAPKTMTIFLTYK